MENIHLGLIASQSSEEISETDFLYELTKLRDDVAGGCGFAVSFRTDRYRDDLFAAFGLSRPPGLARATAKRKAEYLAGRVLAAICLSELGERTPHVGTGASGEPLWPPGVAGSLSHGRDRAVCAVTAAPGMLVGVDIEDIMDVDTIDHIRPLIIDPREDRLVRLAEDYGTAFTAVYSAKETLFKALFPHVRHRFGFAAARLVDFDKSGGMPLELTARLTDEFPEGRRFCVTARVMGSHVVTLLAADARRSA